MATKLNTRRRSQRSFCVRTAVVLALTFVVGWLLASCSEDETVAPQNAPPTVEITAPADGSVLPAGQAVVVTVLAQDDKAISRIELYVNNSLIESRVTPPESEYATVTEAFTWSASIIGSHSLQARAYDDSGQLGASRIVGVEVQLSGVPPEGTAVPETTAPPAELTPTSPSATQPPARGI